MDQPSLLIEAAVCSMNCYINYLSTHPSYQQLEKIAHLFSDIVVYTSVLNCKTSYFCYRRYSIFICALFIRRFLYNRNLLDAENRVTSQFHF